MLVEGPALTNPKLQHRPLARLERLRPRFCKVGSLMTSAMAPPECALAEYSNVGIGWCGFGMPFADMKFRRSRTRTGSAAEMDPIAVPAFHGSEPPQAGTEAPGNLDGARESRRNREAPAYRRQGFGTMRGTGHLSRHRPMPRIERLQHRVMASEARDRRNRSPADPGASENVTARTIVQRGTIRAGEAPRRSAMVCARYRRIAVTLCAAGPVRG